MTPKFGHNLTFTIILEKYEVPSLIIIQKYIFLFPTWVEENKLCVKNKITAIIIQINNIK